jgi:hypothetical protein
MLQAAQQRLADGIRPLDLVDDKSPLAAVRLAPQILRMGLGQSLREVLKTSLPNDQSFNPLTKDELLEELDAKVDGSIDFLIAGHTHLEKSLRRADSSRHYFNSGTWIKLVQIPENALTENAFPQVERALRDGRLETLDRAILLPGGETIRLLRTVRTVVRIEAPTDSGAVGALWHVDDDGQGGFCWQVVARTARELSRRGA